jgi:hypothetical protein
MSRVFTALAASVDAVVAPAVSRLHHKVAQ